MLFAEMQLPESVLGKLAILGTVLIVDDDASVRHTARLALAREECRESANRL